jgi:hypothetical protein
LHLLLKQCLRKFLHEIRTRASPITFQLFELMFLYFGDCNGLFYAFYEFLGWVLPLTLTIYLIENCFTDASNKLLSIRNYITNLERLNQSNHSQKPVVDHQLLEDNEK